VLDLIVSGDSRLMRRVHRWRAPRWFRVWMIYATRGGDGWLWFALGIFLLFAGGANRFAAVGQSTLSAAIGAALFLSMKRLARRRRPCHVEPHCWATLVPPDKFSFPSGHTITAFSVVTPVGLYYPELAWGLFFLAATVAVSRIMLGMHFLSDVIAAGLMGIAIGYLVKLSFSA
jgi:undecaprenyl-diphosphatase